MSQNSMESSIHASLPPQFVGEKEWFFLYFVAFHKRLNQNRVITPELCKEIPISQQTISRRILELEKKGYINRVFENRGGELDLSREAYSQLERIYDNLRFILMDDISYDKFRGTLRSGMREGAHYIKHPQYLKQFYQKVGFFPYFGTLNLEMDPLLYDFLMKMMPSTSKVTIDGFIDESRSYGTVDCYLVEIWCDKAPETRVSGALLRIQRTSHKPNILEFISEQYLREYFQLHDGDELVFQFQKSVHDL